MKKISMFLVLALALLGAGVAFAETVEGTVSSVDLTGKMLKVEKTDATTGAKETVDISVDDKTAYEGEATSLEEVIEGDKIKVEADKDATSGKWVAKSVNISLGEEPAAAEEAPAKEAPAKAAQ